MKLPLKSLEFLYNSCHRMISKGEVDETLVSPLKQFHKELSSAEEKLFELSREKDPTELFPLFHAIEIEKSVISALIGRLPVAKSVGDNPTVAKDTISIFPEFALLHENLININKPILLELSTQLQIKAMNHKLYPSKEEMIKSLDKKRLTKDMEVFVGKVGDTIDQY